jgi:sulfate transport system ATP-binding protein
VNVFHGRVQDGVAHLHGMEVAYPEYPHSEPRPATVYVRPHELEVGRSPESGSAVRASIQHVHPARSVVRLILAATELNLPMHVDLPPDRFAALKLAQGDDVFVWAKQARVFMPDDYEI